MARRQLLRMTIVTIPSVYALSFMVQKIQDWKIKSLYSIYKTVDDPADAMRDWKQIEALRRQKIASKAALSKYKFDPQSYH